MFSPFFITDEQLPLVGILHPRCNSTKVSIIIGIYLNGKKHVNRRAIIVLYSVNAVTSLGENKVI